MHFKTLCFSKNEDRREQRQFNFMQFCAFCKLCFAFLQIFEIISMRKGNCSRRGQKLEELQDDSITILLLILNVLLHIGIVKQNASFSLQTEPSWCFSTNTFVLLIAIILKWLLQVIHQCAFKRGPRWIRVNLCLIPGTNNRSETLFNRWKVNIVHLTSKIDCCLKQCGNSVTKQCLFDLVLQEEKKKKWREASTFPPLFVFEHIERS